MTEDEAKKKLAEIRAEADVAWFCTAWLRGRTWPGQGIIHGSASGEVGTARRREPTLGDNATDPIDHIDLCGRCEKPNHLCVCPVGACWDCDKRWRVLVDGRRLCLDCAFRVTQKKVWALQRVARSILEIINESEGVAGWHLNGNIAKWSDFPVVENLRSVLVK